jgi:hypothetical protein
MNRLNVIEWQGLTCPHCGNVSAIDPAELKDESPMPYCGNCDSPMLDEPDDYYDDADSWSPCDDCDLPDACNDFGCAIKAGLRRGGFEI